MLRSEKILQLIASTGKRNIRFGDRYKVTASNETMKESKLEKDKDKSRMKSLKKYWFSRYVDYIKNYEEVLAKNFPRTMRVYRVFSVGTKDLYSDLSNYMSVIKKQKRQGIQSLTLEQMQLFYTMPRDLVKIAPVLLISAIPFTNYIVFPLAFFFPRVFLTSHYWSLQQRFDFALMQHKKRLKHNKPLYRCMQAELDSIKDIGLRARWSGVIACLGSGTHPPPRELLATKLLFQDAPYGLGKIKRKHMRELLGIHGMSKWSLFRRARLKERGMLIKHMDNAIIKEGGPVKMSKDALRWALGFRGVNPATMSTESMQSWLQTWLTVSKGIDESSISLLLHCPILLAYNHPTNWRLLYSK